MTVIWTLLLNFVGVLFSTISFILLLNDWKSTTGVRFAYYWSCVGFYGSSCLFIGAWIIVNGFHTHTSLFKVYFLPKSCTKLSVYLKTQTSGAPKRLPFTFICSSRCLPVIVLECENYLEHFFDCFQYIWEGNFQTKYGLKPSWLSFFNEIKMDLLVQ